MKNLIVIGHPDKNSFCYNGIFKTIKSEIEIRKEDLEIIDFTGTVLQGREIK